MLACGERKATLFFAYDHFHITIIIDNLEQVINIS